MMRPLAFAFACAFPTLLVGAPETIRLQREAPDHVFRFRSVWKAPGQKPFVLVLGGGSAKGLAHLGVFQGLEEEGLQEFALAGTSAGALMGACRAAGLGSEGIRRVFKEVDFSEAVFDSRRRTPGGSLFEEEEQQNSVFRLEQRSEGWEIMPGAISGRSATFSLLVNFTRAMAFTQGDFGLLRSPLCVVATNLSRGRLQSFVRGDLILAVRASMSLPAVFRPVTLGEDQLVDGGVVQNLPVLEARRAFPGALVLGVEVSVPWARERSSNPFSLLARTASLSIRQMSQVSREQADLVLSPNVTGIDNMDFHGPVDDLASRGLQAFNASLDSLLPLLHGEEGAAAVEACGFVLEGHSSPALEALAAQCLPANRGWRKADVFRFLRKALGSGEAWQGEAVLPSSPGGTLRLRIQAPPRIRGMILDVPESWQGWVRQRLRDQGLEQDGPFREACLAQLEEDLLVEAQLRGRPLVELRGTNFDETTGIFTLRLQEGRIASTSVNVDGLQPTTRRALMGRLTEFADKPLDTYRLLQFLHRAELELNLQDLSLNMNPQGKDWNLGISGKEGTRATVNAALAYESTWGLHGELFATVYDQLFKGNEWNLRLAANGVQTAGNFGLQHAFLEQPSLGYFVHLDGFRHRTNADIILGWPEFSKTFPEVAALVDGAHVASWDAAVGLFYRFGTDDRGRMELEWQRREARFDSNRLPWNLQNRQDSVLFGLEWDSFDRHTYPTDGALLRLRLGQGRFHPPYPDAQEEAIGSQRSPFRHAYLHIRTLAREVLGPVGAELGFEGGLGYGTTIDRFFILGGDHSVLGTPSTAFLAPSFFVLRAGLPIAIRQSFGGHIQLLPRLDWGRIGMEPNDLTSGLRFFSHGLILRGSIGKFILETGWGQVQTRAFGYGPTVKSSQVNWLIGTRPFDLWKRK